MPDIRKCLKYIFYILLVSPLLTVLISNESKHFKPINRNMNPTFQLEHFKPINYTDRYFPTVPPVHDSSNNPDHEYVPLDPYTQKPVLNKCEKSNKDFFDILNCIEVKEERNNVPNNKAKRCKILDKTNQLAQVFGSDFVILYKTEEIIIGSNSPIILELNNKGQCNKIVEAVQSFVNPINPQIQSIIKNDSSTKTQEIFGIVFDAIYKNRNYSEEVKKKYKNQWYKYIQDNNAKTMVINFNCEYKEANSTFKIECSDIQFYFY